MTASEIALLSLGIAGSGFIVSLFTLYYSHLRPPILHTSVGPYIKIYHSDYHKGMGTSLYVPMSFYNRSNRASIVEKVGIELYRHAEPQKRYFMHWEAFAEYQIELGAWRWKEMAHSLPVLGKSSVQKTAWFCWSARNDERLVLLEGKYTVDTLFWFEGKSVPQREHHEFQIDAEIASDLENHRESQKRTTISVTIDKEMESNKFMSAHEAQKLLG